MIRNFLLILPSLLTHSSSARGRADKTLPTFFPFVERDDDLQFEALLALLILLCSTAMTASTCWATTANYITHRLSQQCSRSGSGAGVGVVEGIIQQAVFHLANWYYILNSGDLPR